MWARSDQPKLGHRRWRFCWCIGRWNCPLKTNHIGLSHETKRISEQMEMDEEDDQSLKVAMMVS